MPSRDYPKCDCGECRRCKQREYERRYRERHPERRKKAWEAWVQQYPERVKEAKRKTYLKNGAAYAKKYREQHPERVKEAVQRIDKRHPERRSAYNRVQRALRAGALVKNPCEICGEPKVHAHHEDYTKPLDVRWLCPKHHRDLHTT